MATIQERLERLGQIGERAEAASVQQRLEQLGKISVQNELARSGESGGGTTSVLPVPGGGQRGQSAGPSLGLGPARSTRSGRSFRGSLPQALVQTPHSAPSLAPLPGAARSTKDIQTEMDGVDRALQELKNQQAALDAQARQMTNRASTWNHRGGAGSGSQWDRQVQGLRQQSGALGKQIAQMESDRAALQREWDRADELQFDLKLLTPEAQAVVEKGMSEGYTAGRTSFSPAHRAVHFAMEYLREDDGYKKSTALSAANMALNQMNQGQRDRLAYYVGMGDYDGAADYLKRIAPQLNRKDLEQTGQAVSEWAQKHPVLGTAANAVSWPMNIPAYFDNARQGLENLITGEDRQSPYLNAYLGPKISAGTAQGASEAARAAAVQTFGNETAGDVAAFLTSTGLSIGQNAAQIAALGPLSLAGMSMSAAGSAATDALDRGATPGQAFLVGTAGGAIEAVTEKIPLDNLFRLAKEGGGQGLKSAIIELFKQMGVEASEEMLSEIANNFVDTAVMGDSSEFQARVRELVAEGLSRGEAEQRAYREFYVNVALAGLGGAISGGVMSGGAMIGNQLSPEGRAARTNAAIDQAYAAMQEKGLFSTEAGQAAKTAADRLDKTRRGRWDGIYLPMAEQGDALPKTENAVQSPQEAVETVPEVQGAPVSQEGREAPQGVRRAAEGQGQGESLAEQLAFVEDALRKDYEAGRLEEAAYQEALAKARGRYAEMTAPQTGTERAQDGAQAARGTPVSPEARNAPQGPQTTAEGKNGAAAAEAGGKDPRLQELVAEARNLRQDYAQGKISDEAFEQAMDGLQAEAELTGLEASQAWELLNAPIPAANMTERGAEYGTAQAGEQLSGGDGGRLSGAGAGGENGSLAEGGPQGPADAGGTAVQRKALGESLQLEAVSSRELGLVNGSDSRTVRVLPEDSWDGELRTIARKVRRETGLSVRFTLGPMETVKRDGRTVKVRGVYNREGAGIVVQADNRTATAEQIADHEIFHSYAQADPGLVQAVEEAIVERFSQEELDRMADQYIMALRGIVDAGRLNEMDGAAYAQALLEAKNEMLADAFAGINAFGTQAAKYQETVYETLEGREAARPRGGENAEAVDRRTGPPDEQFSFEGRTEDGIEVYETSEEVRRLPYKQRVAAFLDIMRGEYRGRTAKFTAGDGQVYYARFNRKDLNKNIYGDKRSSSQGLTAKVNVGADGDIFELVENAQYTGSKSESGKSGRAHNGVSSWDYFVKTVQIDGQMFDLLANVRKKPGGEYVYSIQLNESTKKTPAPPRQYHDGTAQGGDSRPVGAPTDVFDEAPAPSLASSHSMNDDAQNRMLTGAFSETDAGYITKPHEGTGDRGSAPVSEDSVTQSAPAVKRQDGGFWLPTGEQGTAMLPKGEDFFGQDGTEADSAGQERYSVDEEQAGNVPNSGTSGQSREARSDPAVDALPAKARDYLQRAERRLTNRIGELLSVPKAARREFLQDMVRDMSVEHLETGRISQETRDRLFEQGYEQGVRVDREYYDNYKHVRDYLRSTPITVSEKVKGDITDYGGWRKGAFGTLRLVKDGGTGVDTAYMELQDMAPGLFPEDITHPADQLRHILETAKGIRAAEQNLDEFYGPDAAEFKRLTRRDFDEAAADLAGELRQVKRYADERTQAKEPPQVPTTPQEAAELYRRKKGAQRVYQRAASRNLLTEHDEIQVGRLLRGELELEQLDPAKDNVRGITAVYEAKLEYEQLAGQIREWNKQRKAQLREQADGFLETANQWKDKEKGILYSRETMERNIRDIVPDQELADRINRAYFQPVHQAAAEANKTKNQYRDRVRDLKLSRKKAAGNEVSEAYAVQLLGEAEDNIRRLEESQGRKEKVDGKTLQEWQAVAAELWEKSPNLDQEKIRGAVKEFRAIYDELFQQMNEARVRNGYEPVSYRQGYFPHFQADSEGLMAQFGRALGIDTAVTNLPTTINGLTHTFKPGIQWFGNALERKGFDTAYDAVQGFDRYIEGAADVIHQTDNIQALRALAAQARYRTGDEGLRQQVDRVQANTEITEQEKQALIDEIYKDGRFALSNFVVELDEYTNLLANKKSRADRNMEQAMGRRMYNIVKGLESRVAANMVAVNPASWLTNFVPLTQGWGTVKTQFMLEGMWDTLKAYKADDGMVGMSSFLTNRRGSDPIVKTWAQGTSAVLSTPMEWIDCFTADSLVRARFKQNQAAGLSESASIEEADAWAAGLMADRSKGSTPTLFNRSNPLTKVFTQFQLEVNNQLSYLFKDLPRDLKKKGLAALAAGLLKFFLGAYLYNEVYEYFIGRRCALDPIGILNDSVGDFTGYQMPNLVGMAVDAAQGNEISFETEKKKPFDAVTGLGANVAEELPFIGGVLGGGRVPISSALPDWGNLAKAAVNDEWSGEKRLATAAKEAANPLTYLALPFGGGQVKKIFQGLKAVHEGGSWTVDNEGNDILQYPVFNETAGDKLLALPTVLTFGKSALPTARDWAESGFKSLNAKQTACYQGMTELGVPQRDAFNLLQELGKVQKTDEASTADQKRKLLQEADVSAQGKGVVYYTLMASDKERELMDSLNEGGADMGEAARVLMEIKDAGALETGKSDAKKKAIAESSLSEEEKDAIFRYVLPDESKGAGYSESLAGAGLDKSSAAAVANALNALTPEEGKKTVSDAQKWRAVVDTAKGAEDQKNALLTVMSDSARARYEIGDRYGIQPEAWVQVKEALPQFDENKNGSYSSGEIETAIDALAGDGRMLAPWDKEPLRLSREEKAVLWQLFTGSTSGSGNPYSTRVGRKVAEELEKVREEAKKKEEEE